MVDVIPLMEGVDYVRAMGSRVVILIRNVSSHLGKMREDHWRQNLVDVSNAIDISPDDDESGLGEAGNPSPDHYPTTVEGLDNTPQYDTWLGFCSFCK